MSAARVATRRDDVSLGESGGREVPDTLGIKYATTRLADLPKGQAYGT